MINGLHLYSAFMQSAVQFMPLIHTTHSHTNGNWLPCKVPTSSSGTIGGLGVLLRDTSTCPGWDRTGDPPTARQQLLTPEPHRPISPYLPSPRCVTALYLEVWGHNDVSGNSLGLGNISVNDNEPWNRGEFGPSTNDKLTPVVCFSHR